MYKLIKLNLARNSLRYIIRTYGVREMYVPHYLCGVVRQALIKEKCKPLFYHIDDDFMPAKDFPSDAFILYPNYFGICDKNADLLCEKYNYLILDNAHAFYNEPKGFAAFNSARKFMPVYNGSYLWIKDNSLSFAVEKTCYGVPAGEEEMYKNENEFNKSEIEFLHDDTVNLISEYNDLSERRKNFLELHKKYGEINLLNIDENANSPFCYPCLLNSEAKADALVLQLKSDGMKIYRYWEKLPEYFPEYKFFSRLVAIPLSKELQKIQP